MIFKKAIFFCFLIGISTLIYAQESYKDFYRQMDQLFPNKASIEKAQTKYVHLFRKTENYDYLAFTKIIEIIYIKPKDSTKNLKTAYNLIETTPPNSTAKAVGYYWAAIYLEKSSLGLSRQYLESSIEINRNNNNSFLLSTNYHILGRNYYRNGEYNKALMYFRKALNYFVQNKETTNMSSMYNNFGLTYAKLNNYPMAIKNAEIALDLLNKKGNLVHFEKDFLNNIKVNLGTYYDDIDDDKNAEAYYEQVYQYAKENPGSKQIISKILPRLYNFYLNRPEKLNDLITTITTFLNQDFQNPFNIQILRILQKNAIKNGNIAAIQKYSEQINKYSDLYKSFILKEQRATTEEMNKYLINYMDKEKQITKQREKFNHLVTYFVILLMILLVVYFYKITLLNKKKAQIKNDLLEKEKSIIEERMNNLSINLDIKSKTEKEFLLRLKKLKKEENYDTEEVIKDLYLKISNLLNIDKKQFLEIEKNNSIEDHFKEKITATFPNLSSQEVQLCGYIHLSLSNKEIATLENLTPPTVRVYKTRLKAKLGLSKEQDLENYIKSFY